jgi:hypothetical protein
MNTIVARRFTRSFLLIAALSFSGVSLEAAVPEEANGGCKTIVEHLYRGILRRAPTPAEYAKHGKACADQLGNEHFTFFKDLATELGAPNATVPPSVYELAEWHYCRERVRDAYRDYLGRDLDVSGVGWVGHCRKYGMDGVRKGIKASFEYIGRQKALSAAATDPARVQCQLQVRNLIREVHKRDAHQAEVDGWTQSCLGGMSESDMRTTFLNSGEYGHSRAVELQKAGKLPKMIPATIDQTVPEWATTSLTKISTVTYAAPAKPPVATLQQAKVIEAAFGEKPVYAPPSAALVATPVWGASMQPAANTHVPAHSTNATATSAPAATNTTAPATITNSGLVATPSWTTSAQTAAQPSATVVPTTTAPAPVESSTSLLQTIKEFIFPKPESSACEVMVRSLYQEVLGREVDSSGLQSWTQHCKSGMTETEMRRQLMSSQEYIQKQLATTGTTSATTNTTTTTSVVSSPVTNPTVQTPVVTAPVESCEGMVRRLYREILGREVDPSGLYSWTRHCSLGMTEAEMRRHLMASPEYIQKLNSGY